MKTITINEKEYTLKIGLAFVAELDKKHKHSFGAVEFGYGIGKIFLMLAQYNPIAISDFISAATITLDNPPTLQEIENQFDDWSSDQIVELCEAFLDLLVTSSITKAQVAQIGIMATVLALNNEAKSEENPE